MGDCMTESVSDGKRRRRTFRLTDDEYETLRSKASIAGMTMTDFIVATAVAGRTAFVLAKAPGALPDELDAREGQEAREVPYRHEGRRHFHLVLDEGRYDRLSGVAKASGLSRTACIKRMIDGARIYSIDIETMGKLYAELRRQGGNLNQMAKKLNLVSNIAWRDDVDGSAIDALVYGLEADNSTTRAAINDAIRSLIEFLEQAGKDAR